MAPRQWIAVTLSLLFCLSQGLFGQRPPLVVSEMYLVSGQAHDYPIEAVATEPVRLVADSIGIGIDVQVLAPGGAVIKRLSAPVPGRLTIEFVADAGGRYRVRLAGRGYGESGSVRLCVVDRTYSDEGAANAMQWRTAAECTQ